MTKLHTVLRILLGLFLLMPVAGALGFLPGPTADLYSPDGWAFMSALMASGYLLPLLGIVFGVCAILLFINKTALAAILLAPLSVNIICFHLFVDQNGFASASMGIVLILLNAFFLWYNREKYKPLW